MPPRKIHLITGQYYHIYIRAIDGARVFEQKENRERMRSLLIYYLPSYPVISYSLFLELHPKTRKTLLRQAEYIDRRVDVLSNSTMPTHLHLILYQNTDNGISSYMQCVLNGFTRYYNILTGRKGPLWESRFHSVPIYTSDQLRYLTAYLHLNPVTAGLVETPEEWEYSSYNSYLIPHKKDLLASFHDHLDIDPSEYKKYVYDNIQPMKKLAKEKKDFRDGNSLPGNRSYEVKNPTITVKV
ncbi:MAG: hypothetical protein PHW14_04635 [Candidatus Omnitrophica bacterium]|nr:hypothetical protein [Candidatus Omnitrophota bacterium]